MRIAAACLAAALGACVLAIVPNGGPHAQDSAGGVTSMEISAEGKQVYEQVCQACHMADAKGGSGAGAGGIPALAGNANLADKDFAIRILVEGRGAMPWFTDVLTPAQMAAVLTYVRGHFNAYDDPVTTTEVAQAVAGAGGSQ